MTEAVTCAYERNRAFKLKEILGELNRRITVACRLPQTTLEKAKVKEAVKQTGFQNVGNLRGVIEVAGVNLGQTSR